MKFLPPSAKVCLIGGGADKELCERLATHHPKAMVLAGRLNLLQSTYLMKGAERVFVNDSAPLHFASAANAKTTAIYCATHPKLGFGPLAEDKKTVRMEEGVCCSPTLHGERNCPEGHFRCSNEINIKDVFTWAELAKFDFEYLSEEQRIATAVEKLQNGKVIITETDTIPGISVDARNEPMVQQIYAIKKRAVSKSFVVLCSDQEMVRKYVGEIPDAIRTLLQTEEQPVTVVYPGASSELEHLKAKDGSIAIRIPKHEALVEIIRSLQVPIISTSANLSGGPNPTSLEEVDRDLMIKVDHVVKWREKTGTKPSVIVKWNGTDIEVLRGNLGA